MFYALNITWFCAEYKAAEKDLEERQYCAWVTLRSCLDSQNHIVNRQRANSFAQQFVLASQRCKVWRTGKSSENGILCSLVLNMIRHNNSTNLNFNFFFGVPFYDSDGAQGGKHIQKVLCQIINLPFDRDIRPRGRKQQHQNISILFCNLMVINAEILSFQCSLVI